MQSTCALPHLEKKHELASLFDKLQKLDSVTK